MRRSFAAMAAALVLTGCIGSPSDMQFNNHGEGADAAMGAAMADDYKLADVVKACAVDALRPNHPGNADTILDWSRSTPPEQRTVAQAALLTALAEVEHLKRDVPPDITGAHERLSEALEACRSDPADRLATSPSANQTWWTVSSPDDPPQGGGNDY